MRLEYWRRGDPDWELWLTESDDVRRKQLAPGVVGWLEDGTEFRLVDTESKEQFGKDGAKFLQTFYHAVSGPILNAKGMGATLEKSVASMWMLDRADKLLPGGIWVLATGSILGQAVTDWGKVKTAIDEAKAEKDPDKRLTKAKAALSEALRLRKQQALRDAPAARAPSPARPTEESPPSKAEPFSSHDPAPSSDAGETLTVLAIAGAVLALGLVFFKGRSKAKEE